MKPKPEYEDPGLHLTPFGRKAILIILLIGFLLLLAVALTDPAFAAPNEHACYVWSKTCTASRMILGVKVCYAWKLTCISAFSLGTR